MKKANPPRPLRIIGGQWRGRKLAFPPIEGLRPTGDRIRETVFNWLAPELPGARCLDVFAGSGALGFEALSRGAGPTVLLEKDRRAAQQLRDNLTLLNAEQGQLVERDSLQWLRRQCSDEPFDLVFVDPPFDANLWQQTLDALQAHDWLAPGAAVYIESGRDIQYQVPGAWQLHRDKSAGQVRYRLYFASKGESTG